MGQAIKSPDPLVEPASLASTDDLLSQLAGEEIDRLLAESESENVAIPRRSNDTPAEPAVGEAPPAEAVDLQALSMEVDRETLEKPTSNTPSPVPPEPLAEIPDVEPVRDAPATEPPGVADADLQSESAERTALTEDLPSVPEFSQTHEDDTDDDFEALVTPLPIYLRPLEWLNAPLASCPERVREALGKVAIVTLVNAIAVLIYVAIFRKT